MADGRSGIVCDSPEELPLGIDKAMQSRASDCREHVTRNFGLGQMARGYERLYQLVSRR